MLQSLKKILRFGQKTDYTTLISQGAIILDVRSKGEYSLGHINNSINIPIDELNSQLLKLKDKSKTIICCCASGMRSGMAKRILESNGYKNVINGGGWKSLQNKIQKFR